MKVMVTFSYPKQSGHDDPAGAVALVLPAGKIRVRTNPISRSVGGRGIYLEQRRAAKSSPDSIAYSIGSVSRIR
jgi:hypothetical protein